MRFYMDAVFEVIARVRLKYVCQQAQKQSLSLWVTKSMKEANDSGNIYVHLALPMESNPDENSTKGEYLSIWKLN